MTDKQMADAIHQRYVARYDGEIRGCCPLIADEIYRAVGGEVVAGEITFYGGTVRRTHWWVEKDGVTFDPMGDALMSCPEDWPERVEVHRDRSIFYAILPRYERWRA